MANDDPTKWDYFGKMKVTPFLQMCLYYKDKNKMIRDIQKVRENENAVLRQRHR